MKSKPGGWPSGGCVGICFWKDERDVAGGSSEKRQRQRETLQNFELHLGEDS